MAGDEVLPFPGAKEPVETPPEATPPVEEPLPNEAEMEANLLKAAAERRDREVACLNEINAAFDKHGCTLVGQMNLRDNMAPKLVWMVVSK